MSPSSRVHCSARLGIIVAIYYREEKSAGCIASRMTMASHKTRWRCGWPEEISAGELRGSRGGQEGCLRGRSPHRARRPTGHGVPRGTAHCPTANGRLPCRGDSRAPERGLAVGTRHPWSLLLLLSHLKLFRQQLLCQGRVPSQGRVLPLGQGTAPEQGSSAGTGISRARTLRLQRQPAHL